MMMLNPNVSARADGIISATVGALVQVALTWIITNRTSISLPISMIIAFPVAFGAFFGVWHLINRKRRTNDKFKHSVVDKEIVKPEKCMLSNQQQELLLVLNDMGIVGATTQLSASKYVPLECMHQSQKTLYFMGVLGSKWVIEPAVRSEMFKFLTRIENKNGSVRFLLINPSGKAFHKLKTLREGAISDESLKHFSSLLKSFKCLQVHLYDQLPCFRLVFIDGRMVAVSRYKTDKDSYLDSKYGWDAPHIEIDVNAVWSFYHAFDLYFEHVWDNSQKLKI